MTLCDLTPMMSISDVFIYNGGEGSDY